MSWSQDKAQREQRERERQEEEEEAKKKEEEKEAQESIQRKQRERKRRKKGDEAKKKEKEKEAQASIQREQTERKRHEKGEEAKKKKEEKKAREQHSIFSFSFSFSAFFKRILHNNFLILVGHPNFQSLTPHTCTYSHQHRDRLTRACKIYINAPRLFLPPPYSSYKTAGMDLPKRIFTSP